jgi:hypothetical protein
LREGGIEQKAVELKIKSNQLEMSLKEKMKWKKHIFKTLRCNIFKDLTGLSFRDLSVRLSGSQLFQRFCGLITLDKVSVPGNNILEIYSKMFDSSFYRN